MTSGPRSSGKSIGPASTVGPIGCARKRNDVTTPKLPPPPRSPQNRSGWSSSLAATSSPSAVTTSAATRLSIVRPCLRVSHPIPPPRVRPATPVCVTIPAGTASPNACVARSSSPSVTPASTSTSPSSASTRTPFIADRSTTSPSSQSARPPTPCPPLRTDIRRSCSRANRTALWTSDASEHRATSPADGRSRRSRSSAPRRIPRPPGPTSRPRKRSPNARSAGPGTELTGASWAVIARRWSATEPVGVQPGQRVGLVTMRNTIAITSTASTIPTVVPRFASARNSGEPAPEDSSAEIWARRVGV